MIEMNDVFVINDIGFVFRILFGIIGVVVIPIVMFRVIRRMLDVGSYVGSSKFIGSNGSNRENNYNPTVNLNKNSNSKSNSSVSKSSSNYNTDYLLNTALITSSSYDYDSSSSSSYDSSSSCDSGGW
ncbi:RNA-binding protein [Bacillus pacificus]|uniref:RNA-binding protein n=1 Tax=Bacillus cereus group TaxID=86661 RepID=UPI0021CD6473|nr:MULTISPECIES: RNA-binding protein [Bacillus cereus group]MCU5364597.1 RNA-binding protein [Bacillus pacificus]MCU5402849.1 RNA-binding protein [Bacillus pacificus]MDA1963622.1 RNA-binding protein [Bacillus cereus group sp. BcHK10]